ncbi:kinesin motor domain-containing protein [Cyclospora cayetanensis]|uniref:Kinesin motor domain-containing protein n=1 Tax=Cyclospora cayetanensis TaxID=88456 RepID=A0A1D3CU42_9EIME|nr:kinesin motor domain-containing protein [Cyclospora cayetanensis]
MNLSSSLPRGPTGSPGGPSIGPFEAPMLATNALPSARGTEGIMSTHESPQNSQLQQEEALSAQFCFSGYQEQHLTKKPTSPVFQKELDHQHQLPLQQAPQNLQTAVCANRRSSSNSSLVNQERHAHIASSKMVLKCCSRGSSCTCHADTRTTSNSTEFSRFSFHSTRSSTGSNVFGSRRYSSTDSELNAYAAPDPRRAPGKPPLASPCGAAGEPSTFYVGTESCTDWGAISADDGNCSGSSVFVAVRVRPMCEKERRQGSFKTVTVLDRQSLTVTELGATGGPRGRRVRKRYFSFDWVFSETADQEEVFKGCTLPLLQDLFRGTNATVFAYGATAAGKTHTMLGTESAPGVMPRALQLLFQQEGDKNGIDKNRYDRNQAARQKQRYADQQRQLDTGTTEARFRAFLTSTYY